MPRAAAVCSHTVIKPPNGAGDAKTASPPTRTSHIKPGNEPHRASSKQTARFFSSLVTLGKRMHRILRLFVIAAAAIASGCSTNISGDPEYPTGFKVGQVYVLPMELHAIVHRHYGRISIYELLTPANYALQLKKNEEARRRGKPALLVSSGEEELVGISAGTEILITRLEVGHTGSGREMLLFSEFANGPFAGRDADVRFVCRSEKLPGGSMFGWMSVRDPQFLVEKKRLNQ